MHVEAHWQTQDYSQVQLWDTHTHFHHHPPSPHLLLSLSLSLSLPLSVSPDLTVLPSCLLVLDSCVSPPSAQCALSRALISLVLARFCMYSLCLLSPVYLAYQSPFMCKSFFFSPSSLVGMLLFFHNKKVLQRKVLLQGQWCVSLRHRVKIFYVMTASKHSVVSNKVEIFNPAIQNTHLLYFLACLLIYLLIYN